VKRVSGSGLPVLDWRRRRCVRTRPTKKSFTLIELLVVVAIISVLVALLLPSLTKARERAKELQCGSNVRQVVTGVLIYAQSNREMTPQKAFWTQASDIPSSDLSPNDASRLAVQGYVTPQVLYSPFDGRTYEAHWPVVEDRRWWSYTLREPLCEDNAGAVGGEAEISQPVWTPWVYSYSLGKLGHRAIVADRFSNNFVWSYHGGLEFLSSSPNYGNGKGWHVGYGDGSVGFVNNDPMVFCFENDGPGGWPRRDEAWVIFDRNYP